MGLTNLKVYFDTSAWNFFLDWSTRYSLKKLGGHEYLFSSCNLDEFCLSPSHRCQELSSLAWRISNRKKLHDHFELTAIEIISFQRKTLPETYDDNPGFIEIWKRICKGLIPEEVYENHEQVMKYAKTGHRDFLRDVRGIFREPFRVFAEAGMICEWPVMLDQLESGKKYSRNNKHSNN